jgi:dipeptidase E
MCGKEPAKTTVCYIGTATYDRPQFCKVQTGGFSDVGCMVTELRVAIESPSSADIEKTVQQADVIVVSGGNTLFATGRWNKLGVSPALRKAWDTGSCVMAGGSAGAIWVFDGGHSDSADPHYFKKAMLSPGWGSDTEADTAWDYVRVPALGFLPGLLCPHHDRTQSNGELVPAPHRVQR